MKANIINFMGQRKLAAILSVVMLLASIGSLATNGLKLGLDFTGGTQIEVGYEQPADLNQIRKTLAIEGMDSPVVVNFGSETDILIRTQGSMEEIALKKLRATFTELFSGAVTIESVTRPEVAEGDLTTQINILASKSQSADVAAFFEDRDYRTVKLIEGKDEPAFSILTANSLPVAYSGELMAALSEAAGSKVELRRSEFVGPQIGEELRDDGGIGMLFALAVVMVYVALRFQFKFSVGAVSALIHDVVIVLGIFSMLQLDFDLTVLAAVLAVIGYSLNDTIVVADRIRENFRTMRKGSPLEVINASLTQTLGRTIVTSLTTLLVLLALFFVGGELIHNFSIALIVGIVVGTYSSIYVAANVLLAMNVCKEDLMPPKVDEEVDEMP